MKIALAQLNPTIGALKDNAQAIAAAAQKARSSGARLLVTSELSICGYPPLDMLEQHSFAEACLAEVERLAREEARDGLAILVGFPERGAGFQPAEAARMAAPHTPSANGFSGDKPLYNAAALLDKGRIVGIARKRLLPTYDVFDERRWFAPGSVSEPLELDGIKLGVHICEDGWNDAGFWRDRLYAIDPVEELVASGAQILINLSASPWSIGRESLRAAMFRHACARHKRAGVMVNQIGGNDDLIFDGSSMAVDAGGEVLAQLASFKEDFAIVEQFTAKAQSTQSEQKGSKAILSDIKAAPLRPLRLCGESEIQLLRAALELGLADYCRKTGFKDVLLGLSGGIDSALVATIAANALGPEHVLGVGMPSEYSSEGSVADARELAKRLGIRFELAPIGEPYHALLKTLEPHFKDAAFGVTQENIQARIRGLMLMALSNKSGALLLATGNKSELAVGYSTLYADMCGCLEVIGDLTKTRVYDLAREYNREREIIPRATMEKPPSAELRPNQLDTDSLPPYDILDPIIEAYVEHRQSREEIMSSSRDVALVDRVISMIERAEYKRKQAPPMLRVTTRAFGRGRAWPIAKGMW